MYKMMYYSLPCPALQVARSIELWSRLPFPQTTATSRNEQADNNSILVANSIYRVAGNHRNDVVNERADPVSAKERELHEHRLKIGEREGGFKIRNQDVVPYGYKPPHEKKDGHDCEGAAVGLIARRWRGRGRRARRVHSCHYCIFNGSGCGCK